MTTDDTGDPVPLPPISAQGGAFLEIFASSTARTWIGLSAPLFLAAARLAEDLRAAESDAIKEQGCTTATNECLGLIAGVATLACSALEAYINELGEKGAVPALGSPLTRLLMKKLERDPMLEKFELAFVLASGRTINRGALPFQRAKTLVDLRNAVVYYKPLGTAFGTPEQKEELEKIVPRSKVQWLRHSIFPYAWACPEAAWWAIQTAFDFVEFFSSGAGIPNLTDEFRGEILARQRKPSP